LASRPSLLFDLDGTLVHTDPVHMKAFNAMLEPFGRQVDEAFYKAHVMGRQNAAIMRDIFPDMPEAERTRLADAKEASFRSMAGQLEPLEGLRDLLAAAERGGVACCVVTNAPRANASLMLGALGLGERFDVIVIGDEMEQAKPHPLPYLTGLSRLGSDAARSVAFEDSRSGVKAAHAAGLTVVGLATSLEEPELVAAGATLAAPNFTDSRLLDLVRERTGLRV
jgi:HAD superfamily hydrolase (TIGR01509 family)